MSRKRVTKLSVENTVACDLQARAQRCGIAGVDDLANRFVLRLPQQRAFVVQHFRRTAAVVREDQATRRASFPPWPCRSVRPPSPGCRNASAPSIGSALRETDPRGTRSIHRSGPPAAGCESCTRDRRRSRRRSAGRSASAPLAPGRRSPWRFRFASIRESARCTETCRRAPPTATLRLDRGPADRAPLASTRHRDARDRRRVHREFASVRLAAASVQRASKHAIAKREVHVRQSAACAPARGCRSAG